MAKTWDDFFPLLSPHLPGCPSASMRLYLANVTADFLARTHLWREDIDPIFVAPGVYEYDLDADAFVEDIISVVSDRHELQRTDMRLIPNERRYETGYPESYWIHSDNTIRLHPIPDTRIKLKLTAVLRPSRTGTGVEDWIFEMWADAIVSGAIDRLAGIPGKEWSSVPLAEHHRRHYERAIDNARVRDTRGVGNRVQMRPFV